ncbi:metallophosphoesterase [Rouxiella sp. T17]|uniref:metallophosphoesterase n=1 Tax=Rouxiella sp. T17 TaxID=3085684 RepID=UPI002FC7E981
MDFVMAIPAIFVLLVIFFLISYRISHGKRRRSSSRRGQSVQRKRSSEEGGARLNEKNESLFDMARYQKIDGSNYRHIYVIGDIHGCLKQLNLILEANEFSKEQDLLVSVGDIIDRGENSLGCLELLEQPWFACVKGNHEQMGVDALKGQHVSRWLSNGGDWFYKLPVEVEIRVRELFKKVDALPHVIEVSTAKGLVIIAHADYPATRYISGVPLSAHEIMWSRQRLGKSREGEVQDIEGAQRFYFGHTPVEKVQQYGNQFYIDTGAVFGGWLTLEKIQ